MRIEAKHLDNQQMVINWMGKEYLVEKIMLYPDGIPVPYRNPQNGAWCVTRSRDFGGCGRNAIKKEKNVPVAAWLRDIHAREIVD